MAASPHIDDFLLVKKPKDQKPLTKHEATEWLKCSADKYYFFSNYCYIQTPFGKALFLPRKYQRRIIDTCEANKFFIGLAGRQSGKTECLVADIVWEMIFRQSTRVGITSYKDTNVNDLNNRFRFIYENLPDFLKPAVRKYNTKMISFVNGSSCEFEVTKENTFRGKSKTRIVVDEMAFIVPKIAEAFMTSLLPSIMAAGKKSDTKLQIISTPNGTSGQFAEIWFSAVSGKNGYGWVEVKYDEVPDRDDDFEKEMLKKMPRDKFLQEFKCHWISSKKTLINTHVIEAIAPIEPKKIIGDMEIFVDTISGRKLAVACDVSEGIGGDAHAFQVFDIDTLEQVAEFQNNVLTQSQYTKQIIRAIEYFYSEGAEDIYYTYENNGVGAGVARLMETSENETLSKATLISDINGKKTGLCTTSRSKSKGCSQFKDLLELDKLKIHSMKLKNELQFFVKRGASFAAEDGMTDDLVMACIIFMNMLEVLANYEDNVYDTINEIDDTADDEDWGIIF